MLRNVRHHRQRRWLGVLVLAVILAGLSASAFADDPVPDKTGVFQTTPSAYTVPGYTKPDPAKATTKDLAAAVDAVAQSASHGIYSVNFVWTLVAGFLVMFMQAGFALVETGLIRAKNAAHTMSMNFMVYGIGMIGFFICGFAFMCGGANGTPSAVRVARRDADAAFDADHRLGHQRRPWLGDTRNHRLLPDRQRL